MNKKIEHLKNKIYSRFLFSNYLTIIDTPTIFLFEKYTLKNVNKQLLTKKYFKWLSKLQIILKENFKFIDICYFIKNKFNKEYIDKVYYHINNNIEKIYNYLKKDYDIYMVYIKNLNIINYILFVEILNNKNYYIEDNDYYFEIIKT